MSLADSIFVAGAILVGGAVVSGLLLLVFFAAVGLVKALLRPFEARARKRRRARLADAIAPYERPVTREAVDAVRDHQRAWKAWGKL